MECGFALIPKVIEVTNIFIPGKVLVSLKEVADFDWENGVEPVRSYSVATNSSPPHFLHVGVFTSNDLPSQPITQ